MREIKRVLNRDIGTINRITLEVLGKDNIISIYLYGGYGRDEGSWVLNESDKETLVRPYNDYDIALIVKNKVSVEQLRLLENELKRNINIKWIDICQYTILNLKMFNATIKNIDFKYASKWIYGDETVLEHIPTMHAKSISLKDVEVLYITRLWTLVGSFPKNGLAEMAEDEEMFFRNQMAKAILAIVDNILIINKQYDTSYKVRVEKLASYSNDHELIDLSKWALEEKLFPKSVGMDSKEVNDLYATVNKLFFKYFYSTLSKYYRSTIKAPEDVDKYIIFNPLDFVKRKIKKYVFNDHRRELNMYLSILQGYIAFYYFDMSAECFKKIRSIMERKFSFQSDDIDQIRLKVAQLRADL